MLPKGGQKVQPLLSAHLLYVYSHDPLAGSEMGVAHRIHMPASSHKIAVLRGQTHPHGLRVHWRPFTLGSSVRSPWLENRGSPQVCLTARLRAHLAAI